MSDFRWNNLAALLFGQFLFAFLVASNIFPSAYGWGYIFGASIGILLPAHLLMAIFCLPKLVKTKALPGHFPYTTSTLLVIWSVLTWIGANDNLTDLQKDFGGLVIVAAVIICIIVLAVKKSKSSGQGIRRPEVQERSMDAESTEPHHPKKENTPLPTSLSASQKIILAITASLLLLSIAYPPFYIEVSGQTRNVGYSLIFDPPYGRAIVNLAQVALQSASILTIGIICFFLAKK